jgi:methylglutaconyl-CoA hydratase
MIHQISDGYVKTETHNGVTTIEFFHPQNNSLPLKILEDLTREIYLSGTNLSTQVIVLRSGGDKMFCTGASLKELSEVGSEAEGTAFFKGFANLINTMRKCPKLIVGRIHGSCVGGGVGIAAAVDYCIAYEPVEIRLSELTIGIGPFVIGPAVERKIGLSAFSQLAIDSNLWRSSEWAKRKGLFAEVHPTLEGLDESVSRLANVLAHQGEEPKAEIKKMLWKGTDHWDTLLPERAAISARLVLSNTAREAITKILGKRK